MPRVAFIYGLVVPFPFPLVRVHCSAIGEEVEGSDVSEIRHGILLRRVSTNYGIYF